ncbi:MAG: hypothetical protein OHK0012_16430 [Synechococcales cyanobacterium]
MFDLPALKRGIVGAMVMDGLEFPGGHALSKGVGQAEIVFCDFGGDSFQKSLVCLQTRMAIQSSDRRGRGSYPYLPAGGSLQIKTVLRQIYPAFRLY